MTDDVIPLLRVYEYFRGAPDEALREVAAAGRVVHEANAPVTTVGFVLRGRLKAVRGDACGGESLSRMSERGEQFGTMIGALTEPVPAGVSRQAVSKGINLAAEDVIGPHYLDWVRPVGTQHQLFAALALKTFLKTDYRGVVAILRDFAELRDELRLAKVPDHSTLCYAEQWLLKKGSSSSSSCPPPRPRPTAA